MACSVLTHAAAGAALYSDDVLMAHQMADMLQQGVLVPADAPLGADHLHGWGGTLAEHEALNALVAGEVQEVVPDTDSSAGSSCSSSSASSSCSEGSTVLDEDSDSADSSDRSSSSSGDTPEAFKAALKGVKMHFRRLKQQELDSRLQIDDDYQPVSSSPTRVSRALVWMAMPTMAVLLHLLLQFVSLLTLIPLLLADAVIYGLSFGVCRSSWFRIVPKWCMQDAPKQSKLYYRLGRHHRAPDGSQISLRATAFAGGNKPKVVRVCTRVGTGVWHVLKTLPGRSVLLVLLLIAIFASRTTAMQRQGAVDSTAPMQLSFPSLQLTDLSVQAASELLAYELAQQDRAKEEAGGCSTFRSGRATCSRNGPSQP
jgi:hypothetical protein